jgi:phosphoserine phosphatase RsbU/P
MEGNPVFGASGAAPALRSGITEELVIRAPDHTQRVVRVASEAISVGRAGSNTLSYPEDSALSRRHLVIERAGPDLVVRDLDSKNGTELNSKPLKAPATLKNGDRIRAGNLIIEYRMSDVRPVERTVMFVNRSPSPTLGGTIVATDLRSALSGQSQTTKAGAATIDALVRAGQELAAHRPLNELFPLILDLSIQAVQASRGAVLTIGAGEMIVEAARGENFQISSAVRDRVLNEKSSLLVVDTMADADFAARNSIVLQGVRSFIAAPLQTERDVIGLLYVDLTNPTRTFTHDDLNLLTVMANIAAIRIRHAHLIEVEAAQRIHARDLSQAAEIQRGLLPGEPPAVAGLDLAGFNLPCRTVGGDYFDYLPYGEDKLAVVVGDVSGKGMPASLLMASLQAHVQVLTESGEEISTLMGRLNKAIKARTPDDRFITFFLAVFDAGASAFTYCNAGHNPPLLVRADGRVEKLDVGGPPLGILSGIPYPSARLSFRPGDRLIMYSDGVVEACAAGTEDEFGEKRLTDVVRQCGSLNAEATIERVMRDLRFWADDRGYADDVTLVVARRV